MVNENSLTPRVNAYLVCAPELELAGAEFVSLIVLLMISTEGRRNDDSRQKYGAGYGTPPHAIFLTRYCGL
jgi:hypothetical protein